MSTTIRAWFMADFVLALTPFYWMVAPRSWSGVPSILVYVLATGAFVATSIVWAYVAGRQASTERR